MNYKPLAQELLDSMTFRKLPTERSGHISSGERGFLSYLCYINDGAFAGEISREVGISTGRTAIALKNLEKKGFITRSVSESDRRCVRVCITPKGTEHAHALRDYTLQLIESMLSFLGDRDAQDYVRIMKRLLAADLPVPPMPED